MLIPLLMLKVFLIKHISFSTQCFEDVWKLYEMLLCELVAYFFGHYTAYIYSITCTIRIERKHQHSIKSIYLVAIENSVSHLQNSRVVGYFSRCERHSTPDMTTALKQSGMFSKLFPLCTEINERSLKEPMHQGTWNNV